MGYRRILVPVSGERDDERALDLAGLLAEKKHSEVTLVYVVEVKQSLPLDADMPQAVATGEAALQRAENYARHQSEHKLGKVALELLQARTAGAAIVDEAIERDVDIIVMSCRNRAHLGQVSTGETVPYVLKNAPCEVVLTRCSETD